eukprot:g14141.t1
MKVMSRTCTFKALSTCWCGACEMETRQAGTLTIRRTWRSVKSIDTNFSTDHSPDSHQREAEGFGKRAARSSHSEPYTKVHGNATVQERPFHRTWSLHKRQLPMVMHPHPKPWSHSSCPGKKETAEGENVFHRVWLTDVGKRGRWNRHKKKEFYEKQDQEMQSKLPHDLKFCCTDTHYKYWTHLLEGGVKAGGQEKLDYGYRGPSSTKQHFYLGKFENVKHYQRILRTGYFDPVTKQLRELQLDDRDEWLGFVVLLELNNNSWLGLTLRSWLQLELRWAKCGSFDLYRPKHTASMPQLGADFELLRDTYQGEVHISTGMTSREDVDKIIEFWERGKGDAKNRVVLYACTSAYPVQFKDVCLLEIARLKEQYEDRVKAIGFSGHHLGIAIDIAAYVLGATWIERHFTKDRTWKGTDHAASLEFPGLSKLIRDLRATTVSLSYKDGILDVEKEQEAKLKWGFYNARPKEAAKDATAKDAEAEC